MLDIATALGLVAAFVIASVALSPATQIVPGTIPTPEQLAFEESPEDKPSSETPTPSTRPTVPATDTTSPETTPTEPVEQGESSDEGDSGSNNQGSGERAAPPQLEDPSGSPSPGAGEGPPRTSDGWAYDWAADPGVRLDIVNWRPTTRIEATSFGVVADDGVDDSGAIAAALASLGAGGGVVSLPSGELHISSTINLSDGQVLAGAGRDATRLTFTANNVAGVELGGGYPRDGGVVASGQPGTRSLTIRTNQPPSVGQHALLRGGSSPTGEGGQIVEVTGVSPSGSDWTIDIADALAQDLTGAAFSPFDAGQGMGLENLSMAPAAGVNVDYHIVLRHSANSWVTGVTSEFATRSHIYSRQSYRCEVRENTLVEATNKGDGGQGYGLNIANNTTGCLFMQNQLSLLRHSMLLHGGATANVVAYNVSTEPRHPNFTNGGPADMSFHGYAVANLVEGNVIQRVQLTDAGTAGADNTIVRNCITSGPPTLKNGPVRAVLVGNTLLGSNATLQQTVMPPVEWSDSRVYTTSSLFDDDGILIDGTAPDLLIDGNWFAGTVTGTATPPRSAFSAAPLVPATPTGNPATDCPYAP